MIVFFLSQLFAQPNSFVERHIALWSESSFKEELMRFGIKHQVIVPQRGGMLAQGLLEAPSLLSLLNRYNVGKGIAEEIATGKTTLILSAAENRKEFFLQKQNGQKISVLALSRKELYPVVDPFSPYRAQMFHASVHRFQKECKKFSMDKKSHHFVWTGSSCSFGSVWLEWNPTKPFSFVAMIAQ